MTFYLACQVNYILLKNSHVCIQYKQNQAADTIILDVNSNKGNVQKYEVLFWELTFHLTLTLRQTLN